MESNLSVNKIVIHTIKNAIISKHNIKMTINGQSINNIIRIPKLYNQSIIISKILAESLK